VRQRTRATLFVLATALAASWAPGRAEGQTPDDCARAYESAQRLRLHKQLRASLAALDVCASPACSPNLQGDCSTWRTEVAGLLPGVVFEWVDPPPDAAKSARIALDGEDVHLSPDGKPLLVDPGPHVFRFEIAGRPAFEQTATIPEGERAHVVRVQAPAPPPAKASPSGSDDRRRLPLVPLVLGAGALALAGVGTGFEAVGLAKQSDTNACQPPCSRMTYESDKSDAQHAFLAGDLFVGAAIASAATAVTLYLLDRSRGSATVSAVVIPTPVAPGAIAVAAAHF